MAIVDYNHSNNITDEQRLNSLRDSVQRAVDELTNLLSKKAEKSNIKAVGTDIVEEGIIDGWQFIKRSNGVSEAWTNKTRTTAPYSTVGSFSARYDDFDLPEGVFVPFTSIEDMPTMVADVNVGTGFSMSAKISAEQGKARIYSLATSSGSQPCRYKIIAKGRWK